jgi:hypothetical protein
LAGVQLNADELGVAGVAVLLGQESMRMVDVHYNNTDRAANVPKDAARKASRPRPTGGGAWTRRARAVLRPPPPCSL